MNVRMLKATNHGGPLKPGDVRDVDQATAERWQYHRIAEIIDAPDTDPLKDMTVKELQAYAAEHGIELGDATKKADILRVIGEQEAAQTSADTESKA